MIPSSLPLLDVTQLLVDWSDGNPAALDRLMPLVYTKLRQVAHRYMRRERPDALLQTTALVHEAYLRLAQHPPVRCQHPAHFFAIAARLMRHILIDHARRRLRTKHGSGVGALALDEAASVPQ